MSKSLPVEPSQFEVMVKKKCAQVKAILQEK